MGLHSPSLPRCEMPIGSWTSILALIRPRQQRLSLYSESLSPLHTSRFYGDTKSLRQNGRWHHRYKTKEDAIVLRESFAPRILVAKPINRSFQQSHRPRATTLSSCRHLEKSSSFVNSSYAGEEQVANQPLSASGNLEQSYSSSSPSLVHSVSKVGTEQTLGVSSTPDRWKQQQGLEGEIVKERGQDELVLATKTYGQLAVLGQLNVDPSRIQQKGAQFYQNNTRERYIGPVNPYTGPRVFNLPQLRVQQGTPNDIREQWRVSKGVAELPRRREEYSGGSIRSKKPEAVLALHGAVSRGNQVAELESVPVSTSLATQVSTQWGASKWSEAAKKIRKPVPRASERNETSHGDVSKLSIELEPVLDFEKLFEAPEADELLEIHEPEELSREEEANILASCQTEASCVDSVLTIEENQKLAVGDISDESDFESDVDPERKWTNTEVLVVDDVSTAKLVVEKLRGMYRGLVHACDTEVADIDIKKESPVGHGRMICFSVYCGPEADFGDGKSRLWIDVLGKDEVLDEFKSYFEDRSIKKIWHNYSFDKHILGNHGIDACGFYADTMHLARLLDSARTVVQGGYSLEGLTSDKSLMNGYWGGMDIEEVVGKRSMKHLFGKPNIKKNGEEGKLRVVPPVEELQTQAEWRDKWIHYSAFDTVCTWCLWNSLQDKLKQKEWLIEGKFKQEGKSMYDFYLKYWQPFGELLVQMEANGMLLDLDHLAKIEEVATKQQEFSSSQFKKWAAKRCPDAVHMNVGSDAQIRQLLFGGLPNKNKKDPEKRLEFERIFNTPNTDNYIEEGRKVPKKTRPFTLCGLGVDIPVDTFTSAGWPAVGGASLKALAGKVAIDYTSLDEEEDSSEDLVLDDSSEGSAVLTSSGVKGGSEEDLSVYGKAYEAFGGGTEGKEACMALAALCEVASINTLISNFIQPLQGSDIKGQDGRVHCSLNINTETGRLSARRPSLQNQPALEKDRYKIRQAFIAPPGKSLIVADYGQLELRILAHLTNCKSMLKAFEDGGDFHSRTALNMYPHVRKAVENGDVILEWEPKEGETKPPVPLLKDIFGSERRKAKMLNFSIAYGKTAMGLSKDWKVSLEEAKATVDLWYSDRPEVRRWQEERIKEAHQTHHVHTLLGRTRHFPDVKSSSRLVRGHVERAAINTPVQGSAADVAMCAMLEINTNKELLDLGWRLLLQVHDEVILEGPSESAEIAKDLVVKCMGYPFDGKNPLRVALAVDAKYAQSWYAAK
ncbi:DNA polymerase I [Marchantia polymorpha subsp. ruderalis]